MIFSVMKIDETIVNEIYQWILIVEYCYEMIVFVSLLNNGVDSLCLLFLILIVVFSSFKRSIHSNDTTLVILIIIGHHFSLYVMFLTSIALIILKFIHEFVKSFDIVMAEDLFIWILIKIFACGVDS